MISSLCFVGAFVFYVTPLVFTAASTTSHTAELAFIEKSDDSSLIGSVIPASCESSPRVAHFAGDLAPCTPNCPLPWGGSIPYGSSVTAYAVPNVLYPATCASQVRTCGFGGVLSGSYTSQTCSVNMPPNVSAGIDRLITQPTSASAPAGAMASDPEGGPVSITWTNTVRPAGAGLVEIRNSNTLTPSLAALNTIGTYVFMLTATDNVGLSSSDTMNVVVQDASVILGGGGGIPGPTGDIWANGTLGAVSIPTGGTATITWGSSNTAACTVTGRTIVGSVVVNTWSGTSGSETVTPAQATVYELNCTGTDGSTITDAVSVNVGIVLPPDISASPRDTVEGGETTLHWNLNGQAGCSITANGNPTSIDVYAGSSSTQTVNVRTVFTLTCAGGLYTDSVTVGIIPRGFET